jgi:hypothetical protein
MRFKFINVLIKLEVRSPKFEVRSRAYIIIKFRLLTSDSMLVVYKLRNFSK